MEYKHPKRLATSWRIALLASDSVTQRSLEINLCTRAHYMTKTKTPKLFSWEMLLILVMNLYLPSLLLCTCLIIVIHDPAKNHTTVNQNNTR